MDGNHQPVGQDRTQQGRYENGDDGLEATGLSRKSGVQADGR